MPLPLGHGFYKSFECIVQSLDVCGDIRVAREYYVYGFAVVTAGQAELREAAVEGVFKCGGEFTLDM